jgi:hypothetical protein
VAERGASVECSVVVIQSEKGGRERQWIWMDGWIAFQFHTLFVVTKGEESSNACHFCNYDGFPGSSSSISSDGDKGERETRDPTRRERNERTSGVKKPKPEVCIYSLVRGEKERTFRDSFDNTRRRHGTKGGRGVHGARTAQDINEHSSYTRTNWGFGI